MPPPPPVQCWVASLERKLDISTLNWGGRADRSNNFGHDCRNAEQNYPRHVSIIHLHCIIP